MSNEDRIIEAVHDLLPRKFAAKKQQAEGSPPLSPKQALNSMRVAPEFTIELVVAEPLVIDPVAIDWGLDALASAGPIAIPEITRVRFENGQTIIEGRHAAFGTTLSG